MKKILLLLISFFFIAQGFGQTTNDILNVLITNKLISQEQADSLRAEDAIKQQDALAKKKSFQVTSSKALKIGGYGHVRYQYLEESEKPDGFDIRRAYFDVRGDISPYWGYRLQTDFSGSPKIIDLYTDVKLFDYLNFTIGQQILPFSLNNVTSNTKLELPDRAQAIEALASRKNDVILDNNGRDIGATVNGKLLKINNLDLIEYSVGVFNGSGINKLDQNERKDIVGRVVFQPIKGLQFGGSFYDGETADSATIKKDAPSTAKLEKAIYFGKRQRWGVELNYSYSVANLKAEYIQGKDGQVEKAGYYVQAGAFVLPERLQLVGRYDVFDKNTDTSKKDDNTTHITAGANIFFNPNALLQIAYTIKNEESKSVDNNTATVQLQVSF